MARLSMATEQLQICDCATTHSASPRPNGFWTPLGGPVPSDEEHRQSLLTAVYADSRLWSPESDLMCPVELPPGMLRSAFI
jgi:hypothetical protein